MSDGLISQQCVCRRDAADDEPLAAQFLARLLITAGTSPRG